MSKIKNLSLMIQAKAVEDEDFVLRMIGSTEAVDRQGDSVKAKGWDLKNYKKNPVFLWGHDYGALPIGKALKVFVEDDKLIFDIKFAAEEYDFALTAYKLFKGGYLNATSVGFIVKDWEFNDDGVFVITKQELLELSAVTVPANPEALAKGIGSGDLDIIEIKSFDKFCNGSLTKVIEEVEALLQKELEIQEGVKEVIEDPQTETKEDLQNGGPEHKEENAMKEVEIKLVINTDDALVSINKVKEALQEVIDLAGTVTKGEADITTEVEVVASTIETETKTLEVEKVEVKPEVVTEVVTEVIPVTEPEKTIEVEETVIKTVEVDTVVETEVEPAGTDPIEKGVEEIDEVKASEIEIVLDAKELSKAITEALNKL